MAGKQPLSSADFNKMMQADLAKARGCVSRLYETALHALAPETSSLTCVTTWVKAL